MPEDNPFTEVMEADIDFSDEGLREREEAEPEAEGVEEPEADEVEPDAEEPEDEPEELEESEDDDEELPDPEDNEPSFRFANQAEAEKSYREAQERMSKAVEDARKLEERLRALEERNADPEYDADQFNAVREASPQDAFQYALNNGAYNDAQSVIARVQADAQEQAAIAAAARAAGDMEAYQEASGWVQRINGVAEEMRSDMFARQQMQAQKPMIDRQQRDDLSAAWNTVIQESDGNAAEIREDILNVLRETPTLLQDSSGRVTRESATVGYRKALKLAQKPQSVDELVAQKVKEELMKARKANASSASGEAPKGKAAGSTKGRVSEEEAMKQEIYDDMKSRSIGANKFMDL